MRHGIVLAATFLIALTAALPLAAQPPEPPREGLYVGPASCAQDLCHGSTVPRRTFEVDQDEYYVWLHRDAHARAFEVLFEERSAAIVERAGLAVTAPDAPACLACHTLRVPAALQNGGLEPTDGVSCEACHGPASGWRGGHTAEDWSHERSIAAGMTDLRDLSVRAGVCHDCHLGGPGRVVDHDLIAAGHPPLQFELDNFSQAMPPHWRRDPAEGVRAWAVGQAAGLAEGVAELGRRARGAYWPDFSALSCYSCHRTIDEEGPLGPGAAGPYRSRPGLPPWSPARWTMLRVLVERYAPDRLEPLDAAVGALGRQVSRLSTPPAEVAASAEALASSLEPLAPRLAEVRWSPAEARQVALAVTGRRDSLARADVHTAEQAVQALYSLGGYLLDSGAAASGDGLRAALGRLAAAVEEPSAFDGERFRSALAEVETELR